LASNTNLSKRYPRLKHAENVHATLRDEALKLILMTSDLPPKVVVPIQKDDEAPQVF